ncbi:hypothetical protein N7523_010715 [Penicillium sp. IBT 18751x]|nr:hypothetical protein N7523_010715 [Penicillium sp. IBT 18751x]
MESTLRPLLGERNSGFIRRRHFSLPQHEPLIARWRRSARDFLTSRWGHYLVLLLITIDVCCGFSEFLIQLHVCELKQNGHRVEREWGITEQALGVTGLGESLLAAYDLALTCGTVISTFPETLHTGNTLTVWDSYFSNWFHIFDSLVILVAFVIEVALHGMEEELGSLVIVLRLWRVFQIIEELRSASEDTLEEYEDELKNLRQENAGLRQRLNLNLRGNEDIE